MREDFMQSLKKILVSYARRLNDEQHAFSFAFMIGDPVKLIPRAVLTSSEAEDVALLP